VIAEVESDGPAADLLRPGDVVTAVEDQPVDNPAQFLLRLASRQAGGPVSLHVLRDGEPLTFTPVLALADTRASAGGAVVTFGRTADRATGVIANRRNGGFMGTGLQPGDVIVRAGGTENPTPAQVRRLLDTAEPNALLVFIIRRQGEQRVLAVPAPAQVNAARD
jgi:S1-C subfamily serine protease